MMKTARTVCNVILPTAGNIWSLEQKWNRTCLRRAIYLIQKAASFCCVVYYAKLWLRICNKREKGVKRKKPQIVRNALVDNARQRRATQADVRRFSGSKVNQDISFSAIIGVTVEYEVHANLTEGE